MAKGYEEDKERELVANADKLHPWPEDVSLSPDLAALSIYRKAQQQRPHSKWSPIDLIELARASKLIVMADLEFERWQQEGVLVMGGRNGTTPVENPRGRAVTTLNGTISTILRRLGMAAMSISQRQTAADEAAVERDLRARAAQSDNRNDNGRVPDVDLLN